MIFDLFSEGLTITTIIKLGIRLMIILFFLPVHEDAHGYVACKLGDPTAKNMGRLTLNPNAHVDPFGLLLSVLTGVGFAKAVPVNMRNFRPEHRKRNMALVSVAGPLSNVLLAFILVLIAYILRFVGVTNGSEFAANLVTVCMFGANCNTMLAVFNLLPVPPLDGSRILSVVLPDRYYYKIMQYERYIGIVFLILVLSGALDGVLSFFSNLLYSGIVNIVSIPFKLFF